jgi:hypothetical protein
VPVHGLRPRHGAGVRDPGGAPERCAVARALERATE